MSTFTPTQWTLDPPDRPDQLAGAVLNNLPRPIRENRAWGPFLTMIFGGISFGLIPLFIWPKQLGFAIGVERVRLWHFAEWLRIRTGDPEAMAIRDATKDLGPSEYIWMIPTVSIMVMLSITVQLLRIQWPFHSLYWPAREDARSIWNLWSICLSIGYLSHALQVVLHSQRIDGLTRRINAIMVHQNLPSTVLNQAAIAPLWILWIVPIFVGAAAHCWWVFPAVAAGALHQRYLMVTGPKWRSSLAMRVRQLLMNDRPAVDVPMPFMLRRTCTNRMCGQPASEEAVYCARCGTRLPPNHVDATA